MKIFKVISTAIESVYDRISFFIYGENGSSISETTWNGRNNR